MNIQTVKYQKENYLVNGNIFVPNDIKNRDCKKVLEWIAQGGIVEPEYTQSEIKDKKILSIKSEANLRITSAYPEWKQRNHMAAVVDIQNKQLIALKVNTTYTLSADELAIVAAAQAAKNKIFNIRAKSDELEASLDTMTQEQLEAFDPTNDSNWV